MQTNKPFFFDFISNPCCPWSTFWEESLYLDGISDKIGFKKYIYNPELNGLEIAPSRPITARTWAINALKISAYLLGLPFLIMVIGKAIHRSFQSYTMALPKPIAVTPPKSDPLPGKPPEPISEAPPVSQTSEPPLRNEPLIFLRDSQPPVVLYPPRHWVQPSSLQPKIVPPQLDRSLLGMAKRAKLGELNPEEVRVNIRGCYLTNNTKSKFREFFLEAPTFLIAWLATFMPKRDDYRWDENTDIPTYQACLRIVIETDHPDRINRILAFIRSDEINYSRCPLDDVRKCYYFKKECEKLSENDRALLKERMTPVELKVLTLPISIDLVEEKNGWFEKVSKKFNELSEEEIQKMRPEWVLDIALDFGGWSQKVDQLIEISTHFKNGSLWLAYIFIRGMEVSESSNLEEQIKEEKRASGNRVNYLKLFENAPNKSELEAFKAYCDKHPLNMSYGKGAHVDMVNLFHKEETVTEPHRGFGILVDAKKGDLSASSLPSILGRDELQNHKKDDFITFYAEAPNYLVAWMATVLSTQKYQVIDKVMQCSYHTALKIVIELPHPHRIDRILSFIRSESILHTPRPLDDIYKCLYFKREFQKLSDEDKTRLKSRMTADELNVLAIPFDLILGDLFRENAKISRDLDNLTVEEINTLRPEWIIDIALDYYFEDDKFDMLIEKSKQFAKGPLYLAFSLLRSMKPRWGKTQAEKIKDELEIGKKRILFLKLRQALPDDSEVLAFEKFAEGWDKPYLPGAHRELVEKFLKSKTSN